MELRRGVSPEMLAAMAGPFHPVMFGNLDWPDAPVFAHSGVGVIAWGGRDWSGVGPMGSIDVPSEAMGGVAAAEAMLSLIGVPADLDGLGDDPIRGRLVDVHLGVVAGRPGGHDGRQTSGAGNTLIGLPVSLFTGTMDGLGLDANATEGGVDHTAQVTVATGPSARSAASIYHTDEDQRRRFPGDTAGRLVILSYAKAQKLTWPES